MKSTTSRSRLVSTRYLRYLLLDFSLAPHQRNGGRGSIHSFTSLSPDGIIFLGQIGGFSLFFLDNIMAVEMAFFQ